MSSLKFGTSGLRGLVVDLLGRPSYDHVRAFLDALRAELAPGSPVLIGRDLRGSSAAIAATAAAAVAASGFRPLDCGALPTPALALEGLRLGCPAVMVTGSHIPDDRNGLKFYTARGEITKGEEGAILRALAGGDAAAGDGESGAAEPHPEAAARFLARSTAFFPGDALSGLRVGVYQHSTVARDVLAELVAALGGTPVPFGRSSAFVPVDTEAHRPEDLEALKAAAAGTALDAIVSADGDADRPLLADAGGAVLPGDVVGTIAARHLGADAVVVPVTANSAIEAAGGFARVVRTRIGSPFVVAGMEDARRDGAGRIAGFEANGGFLLGSDVALGGRHLAALPTRDAVLPLLAALVAARSAGTTLAALAASLQFKATASHRLQEVAPARSAPFLDRLRDPGARAAFLAPLGRVAAVDETDGIRVTLDGGSVVHFRVSGNAPELRCYAEAGTEAEAGRILRWGLDAADAAMG
ncbi:phosphomannomutase [Lichenibacterium minor]|uniref:Phosphomannomutase n=1 Tax=Lichenibacterium minor TaxID=2316528 RepID=A0A4Q2U952_9HYPH|nr:phosphomannomutase [Lichenibacterium minor]RYC33319.1 phosphomannomutase [Lichenibacterium minor]